MARGLEYIHSKKEVSISDKEIDHKLENFKSIYKESFNGEPVTKDQRTRLNKAIADFLKSDSNIL